MAVSSSVRLSPHFTAGELGADKPEATGSVVDNLVALASVLETVRSALGVPLRVTSGFRPPLLNLSVGGSRTSSHIEGKAADIVPIGFSGSMRDAYEKLRLAAENNTLSPFDQIILYPIQGHIHVGIGNLMRREFRVYLFEGPGGVPLVSVDTIEALGRSVVAAAKSPPVLAILAFAVLVFALSR